MRPITKNLQMEMNNYSGNFGLYFNNFIRNITGNEDWHYIDGIFKMEQADYLSAQTETIKLLEWIKRYAKADLIPEGQK